MKMASIGFESESHKIANAESRRPDSENPKSGILGDRLRWLSLQRGNMAWRGFWRQRAPRCGREECRNSKSVWRRIRGKNRGVWIHGSYYCLDECLEPTLTNALRLARVAPQYPVSPHRVPLGLMLLSRQQVTIGQLHAALQAQREAGRGLIGEWLETLGFVTEQEVTAALARQWSCPVLRASAARMSGSRRMPHLPFTLLESSRMAPVDYVEATRTLHVAFGGRIDYSVLYAIEQMLDCRTEPCLTVPTLLEATLEQQSADRREREVLFDCVSDAAESARIIMSYSKSVAPSEIRFAACGSYFWVRLLGVLPRVSSQHSLDLLLGPSHEPSSAPSTPVPTADRTAS
jgi:hypothetical protein